MGLGETESPQGERVGATPEMVEYVTYTAYGQTESDYRNQRWQNFREQYRFTGNEDDVEVGLSYHGARYYSPALKRFMSADPVTVHSAGSDINPYSYGYGNPTMNVDPDGRFAWWVGAIINSAIYIYQNGVDLNSTQWWTGLAITAGSGAIGGYVGYGVGNAVGSGLASTVGNAMVVGAYSGVAGSMAGYGSAYLMTKATGGNTSGYSMKGFAEAAITGGVSGAVGGGVGLNGGNYAGAYFGTSAGIFMNSAMTGEAPSAESLGISFASAFGGAVLGEEMSAKEQPKRAQETEGVAVSQARDPFGPENLNRPHHVLGSGLVDMPIPSGKDAVSAGQPAPGWMKPMLQQVVGQVGMDVSNLEIRLAHLGVDQATGKPIAAAYMGEAGVVVLDRNTAFSEYSNEASVLGDVAHELGHQWEHGQVGSFHIMAHLNETERLIEVVRGGSAYDVPPSLARTSLAQLTTVDTTQWHLEAIAERFKVEAIRVYGRTRQ
jgi:RHS repeat-associated protein